MCKKTRLFVAIEGAPVKVSLSGSYISGLMVSERVDRQAHSILKVFSSVITPEPVSHWLASWPRSHARTAARKNGCHP